MSRQKATNWASVVLILIILLVPLPAPLPASANAGPPASPSDSGGLVLPGGTTALRIDRELLSIELSPAEQKANVTATYEITNPTGSAISQPLVFIASRGRDLSITLNGQTISATETDKVTLPTEWLDPTQGLDPVTGESYIVQTGGGRASNHWLFSIDVPANGKATLRAQYQATLGQDRMRYGYYVHQFMYVLGPARSWSGFGNLEIQVTVPSKFILAGNPVLSKRIESGGVTTYTSSFQGVPADILRVSAISNAVLLPPDPLDEWQGWIGWGASILLGLLIVLIVRLICGRMPWPWLAALLAVVMAYVLTAGMCLGFLAYLNEQKGPDPSEVASVGYGEMFVVIGWVLWGVAILPALTTPLAAIWSARTSSARRRAKEQRAMGAPG
jgi:hypothetical protein